MKGNFEKCIAITLVFEGGYSNDPGDPGGATEWGITHINYDAYRKRKGLPFQSIRLITKDEMHEIYRHDYWDALHCDDLPVGYDLCVLDFAVNSGTGRAAQFVQAHHDIDSFQDARLAFLERLGHLWVLFGRGWSHRVQGIRAQAHALAASDGQSRQA